MLKGYLIKPDQNRAEVREVTSETHLDEFYEMLKCDTIAITGAKVDGKDFSFVCDDNGMLVEKPLISATSSDFVHGPCLVGRLFICHHKGSRLTSLTEDDIKLLKSRLCVLEYNGLENIGLELD